MPGLLLGRALGGDGRAGVQGRHEVAADVRRAGPLGLLEEDQLLGRRGAPAAELLRPRDAGVPGVEQPALPAGVVGPLGRPVVVGGLGRQRRQRLVQPGPQLGPERRLLGVSFSLTTRLPFSTAQLVLSTLPTSLRGSASTTLEPHGHLVRREVGTAEI